MLPTTSSQRALWRPSGGAGCWAARALRHEATATAVGVEQQYPARVTALVETCLWFRTGIFAPAPTVSECAESGTGRDCRFARHATVAGPRRWLAVTAGLPQPVASRGASTRVVPRQFAESARSITSLAIGDFRAWPVVGPISPGSCGTSLKRGSGVWDAGAGWRRALLVPFRSGAVSWARCGRMVCRIVVIAARLGFSSNGAAHL